VGLSSKSVTFLDLWVLCGYLHKAHYVEDGIMWSACSRNAVSAVEAVAAA